MAFSLRRDPFALPPGRFRCRGEKRALFLIHDFVSCFFVVHLRPVGTSRPSLLDDVPIKRRGGSHYPLKNLSTVAPSFTLPPHSQSQSSNTHITSPDMGNPVSSQSSPVGPPIRTTKTPTIKNAPIVGLIDGTGDFSNYHLVALVLSVPFVVQRSLELVVGIPWPLTGASGYAVLVVLLGLPVTISYWTYQSRFGKRHNDKIPIPEGNVERFIDIKDERLRKKYHGKNKIPMVVFHDAYIAGKADFKGQSFFGLTGGICFILARDEDH